MSKSITNTKDKFWRIFESEVFDILILALIKLKEEIDIPLMEDNINRQLFLLMRIANFELCKSDSNRSDLLPIYQCKVQPIDDDDREKKKWEDKIPDFQFQKTDFNSRIPSNSAKQFVIECKRLGHPTSPNWVLNENYIKNGIIRFISNEWRYGQGSRIGAMIGYVQSMEISDIIDDISNHVSKNNLSPFTSHSSSKGYLTEFNQLLNRTFEIQDFVLRHIWIDLKDKY
jgi:hypothetical protein